MTVNPSTSVSVGSSPTAPKTAPQCGAFVLGASEPIVWFTCWTRSEAPYVARTGTGGWVPTAPILLYKPPKNNPSKLPHKKPSWAAYGGIDHNNSQKSILFSFSSFTSDSTEFPYQLSHLNSHKPPIAALDISPSINLERLTEYNSWDCRSLAACFSDLFYPYHPEVIHGRQRQHWEANFETRQSQLPSAHWN